MQYLSFNPKKISLQIRKFIYTHKRKKECELELEEYSKKPSLIYRVLKHYQDCVKEMFEIKPYSILDEQDKLSKEKIHSYKR